MSDLPLFLVKRLGAMIAIIFVLTAIIFSLQKLSHADPVHAYLGANASKAAIAKESAVLGYNKPVIDQYLHYVAGLFHGDLQGSLRTRRPVSTDLAAYLPATIELSLTALGMALVLGAALGLASAGRWRGASFLRVLMIAGASVPAFLLALLGVLILNGDFHLLPASGDTSVINAPTGPTGMIIPDALVHGQFATAWDGVQHLALPAFCVAIGPAVSIGRVLRGSLHSSMRSDFVRTARAKGLVERTVLFRHALRNSLSAALSMTGLQVGLMFAGVVVIETVFAWPGIGLYTEQSIPVADFPAIAGVTLVLGVFYVVINAIVDILQAVVDPRVALQ
jgi:peptide/nickel transport system permease protein